MESDSAAAERMTASAPALRLQGISKRFGDVVANDDVSLSVEPGEIHALLGENGAGKSTLMNVAFGLLHADAGRIEVQGREAQIRSPRDAYELKVGMVHQHFKLVRDMTISENIVLSLGRSGLGRLRLREVSRRVGELADRFGLRIEPDRVVEDLTVGEHQKVEILKLLYRGADLLILDEPTAVLTPPEWKQLSGVLRALAGEGRSIVFITHKLGEVFEVADRCTVLRDGRVVGTRQIRDTSKQELARLMVGREVALRIVREEVAPGRPVLEARELRVLRDGREALAGVDLRLHEGEVLGVAGVDGNGQSELVDALIGAGELAAGEIYLQGADITSRGRMITKDPRIGVIPEDRHRDALALELSVSDNLMMKDFDVVPFARWGLRDRAAARRRCSELVTAFDIRTPSLDTPLRQLSGGNQQKIVVARELGRDPRLLIAAQPTRGLDVGAMEFVYARLAEFKRSGGATLLISSELEEVLSLSDRIAVMIGGRFVRTMRAEEATPEVVGMLMAGAGAPEGKVAV
jgi:general nucleoside transport system ATP-binding protein